MSKKKKSSGSKSSFNAKNFFIMHVEKLVFGFIALLAGLVAYSGFSAKPFPSAKSPQKLQEQAQQVSQNLKKDHWPEMLAEEGRNVAPVFVKAAIESRKKIDPIQFGSDISGTSSIKQGARRSDPTLAAPEKLQAHYFYGALARMVNTDPLESLEDAKKPEVKPDRNKNAPPGGYPGSSSGGSPSGYPGSSSGGSPSGYPSGPGGPGGGDGFGGMVGDASMAGRRLLSHGYDRGYQFGMRTFVDAMGPNSTMDSSIQTGAKSETAVKKVAAFAKGFVAITALAPHEEMESTYRKEFYSVLGYMEGRDTPNYVGFEAQRVEVLDPNKEIAEADWKPLPEASPTNYKELLKKLAGTSSEVHLQNWVDHNISMPIPPILLSDYRKYASHPEIPTGAEESETMALGGTGGYPSGDGGMANGGGFVEGSGGGSGYPSGGAGSGSPSGYPGSGGGGSSSGVSGYPSGGAGGAPGGYPGSGSGGSGYPGSGGGMPGYSDGGGAMSSVMDIPKKLPSTKYKLIRFYDFTVLPGKVYKYRVRLLMYDPNYPEWVAIKPASSTLANDVLKRVRTLESKEPKDAGTLVRSQTGATAPVKRASRRETEWSASSQAILTAKPASVYVAKNEEKMECVFVDFDSSRGISVPRKEHLDNYSRGLVFGTPAKLKTKDAPIDIIHPARKVIKALKDFKTTNFVTIIDWKASVPLTMGNTSKDPIKTGLEVVSYDPLSGQIVVSREFDNFTGFNMYVQPDSPAVGPLGGGLVTTNSSASQYGQSDGGIGGESDGSMGAAGMNPGMGAPGGMNPGMGSPGGGGKKGMKP